MSYVTSAALLREDFLRAPESLPEVSNDETTNLLTCNDHDNTLRWKEGERLDHLFEARCDQLEKSDGSSPPAVIADETTYSFRDLDSRANQTARHLIAQGVKCGDKVGLLLDKGVDTYVALLAVLKVNAAYVPFDGAFPNDRIAFIMQDARVTVMLSHELFRDKVAELDVPVIFLDSAARKLDRLDASRLTESEKGKPKDDIAYLIYTSGTTGKPKGVVIEHASICNFVRVGAEIYGYGLEDRVYQGMTIAFDYSVEELWVPLLAGSALVPGKPGANLVGKDLADYLREKRVTGWACVPTLLATIEQDLPDLRLLMVSGEACPHNLVTQWARDGRRILNTYGPTESTVSCTWTELLPDKPVTIGKPLPTYTMVILDPEEPQQRPNGTLGEICVAGVGLAQGYLNRPDLTAEKFIQDFIGIPNNPSKRIYRTGDLGYINADGEIEFHGRIDTQVKVRGYRIELTEIESVLMEVPQIAQAVVSTWEPEPSAIELVAYYALHNVEQELDLTDVCQTLRARLPRYMVPAYFERLPIIPMTPSHKADRKKLPAPKGARFVGGGTFVPPRNDKEKFLSEKLAEILKTDRVSIADDFFQDLGAHSLLMAQYCAALRRQMPHVQVCMRDIYLHPTIGKLADYLHTKPDAEQTSTIPENCRIPTNLEYYGTGALQAAFYAIYSLLGLIVVAEGFKWSYAAIDSFGEFYLRLLAFTVLALLGLTVLPIAAKWLLIGHWKEETFPIWSLRYFRFWVIKTLIRTVPLATFVGTPIYNAYLRLLGAKIGRGVVINAAVFPVTSDLLSIGDNTVLRKDTILTGYRAQANYIRTGSIKIGRNAFVGEASVLDIGTIMEDDTQLGHASSLQSGQRVPAGKHYHGSPAVETTANYCKVDSRECSTLRRWAYALALVLPAIVLLPLVGALLFKGYPYLYQYTGSADVNLTSPGAPFLALTVEMAILSFAFSVTSLLLGLVWVTFVPRLFNRFLKQGETYPLYGVHYFMSRLVSGVSNSKFYNLLFGDSSAIVCYLDWIGWDLNQVEQTGSNFGTNQKHDNPFLCEIGNGTMVSDGLSMINAEMSSTSFRLDRTKLGDKNYLGNDIHYPSDGKTGANVLLGTKVMIPIDGPVRENVGLLGSPCFEIPRAVERDIELGYAMDQATRTSQLHKKNRHNLVTIVLYLMSNWLFGFVVLLGLYVATLAFPQFGIMSLYAFAVIMLPLAIGYFAFTEHASLRFRPLQPKTVPVLNKYFWEHERHWKFCESPLQSMFAGTPFKNFISRLLGVKVGRKVFDDGAQFLEKTLITIGDYVNLNHAVTIQGHSLEEGVFKSNYIKIGNACTLNTKAFVHYGVIMGDNVTLKTDSFLMKGEMPEPNTVWQGNPALRV